MVAIANDTGVSAPRAASPHGRGLPGRKRFLMFHDKHHDKPKQHRAARDKEPKRHVKPRRVRERAAIAEYDAAEPELPIGALLEIGDWILDLARSAACDDADDIEIVERVRTYLHGRAHGVPIRAPAESELLTAIALAVAALEKRHGIVGLGEMVAIGLDGDLRVAPRAPGARCRAHRSPRLTPHHYCAP
jgi:hypothetical protein